MSIAVEHRALCNLHFLGKWYISNYGVLIKFCFELDKTATEAYRMLIFIFSVLMQMSCEVMAAIDVS
jgi:hypothetical protein